MKVALLIAHSRVSPVFETTSNALFFNLIGNECVESATYHFITQDEQEMVNQLLNNHIELLICGAIPYYLEKILTNQGCEVISFIAGEKNEIMQALCLNQLDKSQFKMPGCHKRKQRKKNLFCQRSTAQ